MEQEKRQVLEERARFACRLRMDQEIYWEYIRTVLTRSKQFFVSVCLTVMLSLFAITESDMSSVFLLAAIVLVNVMIWVKLKTNYRDLEKRKTNAAEKLCFLEETEVTIAGYDKTGNSLTVEQYPYERYTAVYESKHLLILYSKTLCIVLPKSEFLKGTPRDAMLYLRKKLEK